MINLGGGGITLIGVLAVEVDGIEEEAKAGEG